MGGMHAFRVKWQATSGVFSLDQGEERIYAEYSEYFSPYASNKCVCSMLSSLVGRPANKSTLVCGYILIDRPTL